MHVYSEVNMHRAQLSLWYEIQLTLHGIYTHGYGEPSYSQTNQLYNLQTKAPHTVLTADQKDDKQVQANASMVKQCHKAEGASFDMEGSYQSEKNKIFQNKLVDKGSKECFEEQMIKGIK